jgi:hypothetical protein
MKLLWSLLTSQISILAESTSALTLKFLCGFFLVYGHNYLCYQAINMHASLLIQLFCIEI